MKYYLVAGERSGDLHASNLIKAIAQREPGAMFRGVGGDYMKHAGADLHFHYRNIAVMGFVEVIKNLFRFRKILHACKDDILDYAPDVLILVDFSGFNLRLARLVSNHRIRVFYYISPKLWAWNEKRVHAVRRYVDEMFVILPFETSFYQKHAVHAHYVGNPVVDAVNDFKPDDAVPWGHLKPEQPLVALLPGSRKHEIRTILPQMLTLASRYPSWQFGVSAVRNVPASMYDIAREIDNVHVVYEDNYNLLHRSFCAVVASGTATLETALFNVPQVVVYRLNAINWIIGRLFVKLRYVSLVNLIADRMVVTELLQGRFTPENLQREFDAILNDDGHRESILAGYQDIRDMLGKERASDKAADLMIDLLK